MHGDKASRYFGGATISEIGASFSRIDRDGSVDLTWEEFVAAAAEHRSRMALVAASKAELRELFKALDVNADGRVSRKEWGHAISKSAELAICCFGGATLSEIASSFSRIDVDGSDDLTWGEFVEAAAAHRQKVATHAFATAEAHLSMVEAVMQAADEGREYC
eukprot:CAMPEP_0174730858 /NCGR_PEP_ID=MMETSP1094-20130205/56408_1 /TAXON_ID=156173 /ORGANISM="Chrysochromulina brevifilum, Strain UTEX LB 985" /LENGTH=162 /DNA_ID=CAMNT_0015933169 /DNA_START=164 /DNA_END=652 /DNA_ORIENTATION=-